MNKILQHHYGSKNSQLPPPQQKLSDSISPSHYNNIQTESDSLKQEEEIQKWVDQYNSPKESIRMSSERFPKSFKLSKELSIPLSAIIQPYYSGFV